MSNQAKVDLMSSAEAAQKNFTTDNVKHGGCKECNCQLFIYYHYDDGQPIAGADLVLVDSTKTTVEAKTDKNGLCKIDQMGCGSYKLMLGEGTDTFSPQMTVVNNPSQQVDPEDAALAGEYFSLYTLLSRQDYLTYDADDSSDGHIDVDRAWFTSIPEKYQPAYRRYWQLLDQINQLPEEKIKQIHKIHSSLAAEVAGHTESNEAVLLMCQVILGCVPVVGQAMDLYFLGDWCWETYEGKDDAWHWANGALILVGFIPGLGDALKTTGQSIMKALRASDKAAIQLAVKTIRSLSNGNVVHFLSSFASHISEYIQKGAELLETIIKGLRKALKESDSWLLHLLSGVFESLVKVIETLKTKLTELETWINQKIEAFIPKVVTEKVGMPKRLNAKKAEDVNAGKVDPNETQKEIGAKASTAQNESAKGQVCNGKGEPIDMNTGKVFESRQDFILPGYLSLNHERYFHSTGANAIGLMGRAWRSSWDVTLQMDGDTVTFVDKDYTQAIFPTPLVNDPPSRSQLQPQWRLYRTEEEFILYHQSGVRYHFGYALGSQLRLSAMSDSYGHQIHFLYRFGTLKWVVLADDNLIQVSTDHNRITALALMTPERQLIKPLASYQYDRQGRLTRVRAGEGCNFDYQYTPQGYLKRWQDLAYTWVEHDYDEQGRAIATRCSGHFWNDQISYDNDANITYYTSAFGGVSEYHRDAQNRLIAIVDPEGNRTEQQWDLDNLIAVTDPTGATTEYSYDDWGNITEAKLPDGSVHQYEYDDWGRPITYTDPLGSQWHYEYNSHGDLTQVTDPLERQWRYQYDDHGQRIQSTAPDGVTTAYQYNRYGLLAAVKPQVGVSYEFIYDPQYRLIERHASNGSQRRWLYNEHQSQPERVVYEDGSEAQFDYDVEGNLTTIIDAAGNRHQYQYGPFDRLLRSVDPMGASTRYHYNPEAEFAGVTNSQKNSWQFDFNPSGQLVSEQHYDGRKELYHYDEAGRVREQIKPDGIRRLFQYDALGQVIGIEHRTAADELLSASDYRYDAAGRLISAENDDAKVEFVYNAAGQVVQEIVNGEALTSDYDESGIRSQLSGAITARQLSYQQGQLSQLKLGEHDPLNFAYTPEGFEQYRDNGQGFALHQQWSPSGLLQSQKLGFQHNHPERVDDKLTLRNYHYDKFGQLTGIDDSHWGSDRFELNKNGQVTKQVHQSQKGNQQQQVRLFGYDSELNLNETAQVTQPLDNVVPISQAALNKEKRQYDNAGRVVKTGRFTYHYDECGRAIQKIEQKDGFRPQTTTFSWDENDRLIRIELPNGERWRYRYDAFGRRLTKECEQGAQTDREVHYRYDGAQVVQQTVKAANGDALQTTEYIYEPGSFRPVAQVNRDHVHESEQLHYVITDQAGTPRELCGEDGDIVWRGEQGLWQHHRQQQLKLNVERQFEDAANDPMQCDLRYQGQLEDQESGLYYNLNRYYDADSGQYLSSDPIGMAGGLRPQAYVHNPMEWVDPLGLTGCSSKSKYQPEEVFGRKVYKNTEDIFPGKPEFVDSSVHPSIKSKVEDEWTNLDLMNNGYAPIGPDGKQINLHHVIGKEAGPMVEIVSSTHKKYHKALHGLIEDGNSFRNNAKLERQYNKFRKSYWKARSVDFL